MLKHTDSIFIYYLWFKMASSESIQDFVLKEITSLNRKELGRGAYGKVYAVKYCETICAAKEIHSILIEDVGEAEKRQTVQSFLRECRQCSMLRHPNVIQFLGIYYPTEVDGANTITLPVMVMEMMADSLTSFVDKHEKIPVYIKYSILHDVSLGLCYLHNHDPPIVHRDLSPNNVLLTTHHVAKISDLGVAKVIKTDSRKTMTKAPGTVDFMPPEALSTSPRYGLSLDVFSFGGIILHTFNQQWPRPTEQVHFDPKTRRRVALSEVERRQQYLDKMIGEAEVLRPLVEECLDDDPAERPTIRTVCKRIQVNKDAYMKESPQDVITLHHELKKKEDDNERLNSENEQIKATQIKLHHKLMKKDGDIEQLNRENEWLSSENKLIEAAQSTLHRELTNKRNHIEQLCSENERLCSENELMKATLHRGLMNKKDHIEQLSTQMKLHKLMKKEGDIEQLSRENEWLSSENKLIEAAQITLRHELTNKRNHIEQLCSENERLCSENELMKAAKVQQRATKEEQGTTAKQMVVRMNFKHYILAGFCPGIRYWWP